MRSSWPFVNTLFYIMIKPLVVVTRKLPEAIEARLRELCDVQLNDSDIAFTKKQLIDAASRADVLVPTVTDNIDYEILANAGKQLKLIANFGAGVDHIDLNAAKERGITVCNTPSVLTEDTADVAMTLIIAASRRLPEGVGLLRSGGWKGWSPTFMLGRRVAGQTLGIIGLGRIGQAVARRAKAFGLNLVYHNRKRLHVSIEQELGATYAACLDDLLASADIVSLHCPHTAETHHLLSAKKLARMKQSAVLVNVSRGSLIDENALVAALKSGKIAGAALDVFEHEPAISPDLLALPNVVLTPHMSSATLEARIEMGEKVLINIRCWADGHRPPDRVIVMR
jgi:glyoxylate reductase